MLISKAFFQKHQTAIALSLLSVYFFVNGLLNSTTVLMEGLRESVMPFEAWEPFVWEFSSAIGSFMLVVALVKALKVYPWDWQQPKKSFIQYLCMGLAFCALHVTIMIVLREAVYALMGKGYDFAIGVEQWVFELFYEFRKDIWSFAFFVVLIWCYQYVVAQWLGDAREIVHESVRKSNQSSQALSSKDSISQASLSEGLISRASVSQDPRAPVNEPKPSGFTASNQTHNDLLLVKKLGREFLVNKQDIDWIESSGNYLNLYIGDDVYPMRDTLKSFLEHNFHLPIKRVHRSYAINLNAMHNLIVNNSGDGTIELKSGHQVKMSRRYKLDITD